VRDVAFRSVSCVLLLIGVQTISVHAIDLSLKSTLSQSLEVNDNYFLIPAPIGTIYTPLSSIVLDAAARTATTRYALNADISYSQYLGPGAEDASLRHVVQNGLSAGFEHAGKVSGDKLGMSAWWRHQDIASAQLNDIGVVTARGAINTHGISGTINRQLNSTDSLGLSVTGTSVSFESASTAPFANLTTAATWKRRVNRIADVNVSAELNWTVRDDKSKSETKLWKATTGLQVRPTPRLTLNGSVGAGVVTNKNTEFANSMTTDPLATVFIGSGPIVGLLADAQASYKLWNTTELSLYSSRSITPGILGVLSQRTTYGAGMTHSISSFSSLSINGQLTRFNLGGGSPGDGFDMWTANATYMLRLSREWRTQFTYYYRQRDTASNSVRSNAIIMVLARDVTVLP
jgi:hypothetical protein